ncbi:uncharacterized protein LOC129605403 [Condylostylus longicornis]|uniref:uncharacterized protein LOC129605403 n=1 Tax=Condylostylus longicornis TaxID=2530218 RepID=UPI00244DD658|nr:uncharacterized protein LOC129605403 [Condylostylus longicornis]
MAKAEIFDIPTKIMKDFNDLSLEERLEFLDSFDIAFCDCDGVIWKTMQETIPNIGKSIEFLRANNKKIIFVTNNSLRTFPDQIRKFAENHIDVNDDDIIRPSNAIAAYLNKINFNGIAYVISNSPFRQDLEEAGINTIHGPNGVVEENFEDLSKHIFDKEKIGAVIIDIDFNLSVTKLIKAHLYLKNENCLFIGGAFDTVIPFGNTDIVGPGPFISVVEKTTGKKPKIFGKPGHELGELLLEISNDISPNRVLFIGDHLNSDIKFANHLGFQTLLVFTGATKRENLSDLTENDRIPDYIADTLVDIIIP